MRAFRLNLSVAALLFAVSAVIFPVSALAADATDALSCASVGGYCLSNAIQTACPTGETIGGRCGAPLCCIKPASSTADLFTPKMIVGSSAKLANPLGPNVDFLVILSRVISAFLGLVGALALLVFFYAGVRYMTAAGEEKSVTQAKDTMKYAFLGLFFIIFAYVIANFFFQTLVSSPK